MYKITLVSCLMVYSSSIVGSDPEEFVILSPHRSGFQLPEPQPEQAASQQVLQSTSAPGTCHDLDSDPQNMSIAAVWRSIPTKNMQAVEQQ